ncbi:MAG TPA: DUF362 domain-containing protein [Terriglobales bacterium]|nr:DUF362 domain-containing protein [Terriglobales bacterium]
MLGRRQFLSSIALLHPAVRALTKCLVPGLPIGNGRGRQTRNIFLHNARPLLIAVEGNDIGQMLTAGLDRLPQLEGALNGKHVLVKPNATASEAYPVTTDLALLKAVVRYVRRAGAARITICDSSSFAGFSNDRVFRKLGYFSLVKEESVGVTAVDSQVGSEYVRVSNADWKANNFLMTDRLVNQADFVINLAVPKRHHAADFSCALKNNFGCTYGTFRMLAHMRGGEFFDRSLVEFADAVRPNLTIVDARSILAKAGPSFQIGKSEIVAAHQMVFSGDMVAVDSYCGRLMENLDPTFSPGGRLQRQLQYAQSLGLGEPDPAKVETLEI